MVYQHIVIPPDGAKIQITEHTINVPPNPIILFIEGDGIGPDITRAMKHVVDAAVTRSYRNKYRIIWVEIYAGEKALQLYGNYLPDETIDAIKTYAIAIKGPLTTPVGGGIRSLNVIMRQVLDLYQCIRPCKDYGAPSPVKHPEKMDLVIFRENTEDVYAGVEFKSGSPEAVKLQKFFKDELHVQLSPDSGIGIKLISNFRSKRLVRSAIQYAVKHHYRTVTLVHKGNIMKFTEGAFRDWGYQVAKEEFGNITYTEEELEKVYGGKRPEGKILINDRIADNTFQQILLRTDEYEILACPNLNGDYLSDAAAAQVGGLGMAPGANIGDNYAIFEATHGTAPKYTNQDKVNPSSLILSAAMMLEYMGWQEAADLIKSSLKKTIQQHLVTYDLARQFDENITPISTSKMAEAIIKNFSI